MAGEGIQNSCLTGFTKNMNTQKSENTFFLGTKSYSQACMGTTFLSSTHSFLWLDTPFDTLQSATPSSGFNALIHPSHQFLRPSPP